MNTSLVLLGNGDINNEGKLFIKENLNVKPWIFWPRRPFILEKVLDNNSRLLFHERKCETIFIGNFENSIQAKYRQTTHNWQSVLDEYHCTAGTQHKFSQEEYLKKLSNAKFGLALRGFGSKCHREVELMALGTVPIITPEVSIKSYMNSPEENIHYLTAKDPIELKEKINNTTEKQWELMSNNCYNWYQINVHSKNVMNTILTNIFYS